MKSCQDIEIVELLNDEITAQFQEKRDVLRQDAKTQIYKDQDENRRTYNLRRRQAHKYQLHDLVAIKRTQFGPGLKLKQKYLGPYKVTKKTFTKRIKLLDILYIHWCAKIKDEVEKLAYQLNEEAQWTERLIRRLSRIIGKLEEGRSVTSVAADFGIAHSIVSRLWRQFQTTGTAIRGTVVVVHEESHPQMSGTLSYRPEETGGRQREKSLDTRHRRLDDRYRVLPWPEDCTVVVCLHESLYDESRFSLSSNSHRILIWRERGSRNHPSNINERDRYGGRGVLVWRGIMLGSRTDLHIFDAGSVNGTRYCNEILLPYVRLFRGAMDVCSSF
ncbi:transposable element Tcb1 transposase [Trichonephila clavipes]|nr:transposable element Tcb1 transposase [Trichonephila clavipes]